MRVLGIDPGSRATGYGLVDLVDGTPRVSEWGVIRPAGDDVPTRLLALYRTLRERTLAWRPAFFACESVFVNRSAASALVLGHARGVALCAVLGIDPPPALYEYTPSLVRKTLTGDGSADKVRLRRMVVLELGLAASPPPLDASDALALALCCVHRETRATRFQALGARP